MAIVDQLRCSHLKLEGEAELGKSMQAHSDTRARNLQIKKA